MISLEAFRLIDGIRNFGGLISTASGIIFANGTIDSMAYGFNIHGDLVWSDKLPFLGSAPPMSYTYFGCQYILFTATGGKWYDNKGNGDKLLSYKLKGCKN